MDDSERQVDPEVESDLRLRAQSEHDPTRTRTPRTAMGGAWPPVTATHWLCRVKSCRVPVPVTEDAVYALSVQNAELARRGDTPIEPTDVVFCADHDAQLKRARVDWSIQVRAKTRDAILELTADPGPSPERERDLLEKLDALGHPDVKGLALSIAERRKRQSEKTARRTV